MEMFLASLPMVYTFRNSYVDDFNYRNTFLTSKILKQGYWYHKLRKAFFYILYRHSELIVKYNVCLKILLQQGILWRFSL